jgi:hypothetical protein
MPEIQLPPSLSTSNNMFKSITDDQRRDAFSTPDRKTQARNFSPGRKSLKADEPTHHGNLLEQKIPKVRLYY